MKRTSKLPIVIGTVEQWNRGSGESTRQGSPAHLISCSTAPLALPSPVSRLPSRRRRERSGLILLVVLALLTLFTLLLTTFALTTIHNRLGVQASSRAEQTGEPPEQLLHRVAMDVFRGPRNPLSPIGAHSLLEDMYGHYSVRGQIFDNPTSPDASSGAQGQLLRFQVLMDAQAVKRRSSLAPIEGDYTGLVLTMLTGPAAGRSTHIVGHTRPLPLDSDFESETFTVLSFGAGIIPNQTDSFLVNGRPFSGTGFGFDPQSFTGATPSRLLDAKDPSDYEQALLPNHAAQRFRPTSAYPDPAGPGGANEDYDAPDFQNMLLALRYFQMSPSGPRMRTLLPSLHRPDLVYYWQQKANSLPYLSGTLRRQVVLRPQSEEHPNFDGSNAAGKWGAVPQPVGGGAPWPEPTWDVDNDGDGDPDGIWIDPALPVMTARDGRTYKVLVSILCEDMDGRFNINAHGNLSQTDKDRFKVVSAPYAIKAGGPYTQTPYRHRLGMGLGPPEISLHPLFDNPLIFTGGAGGFPANRHGEMLQVLANQYSISNIALDGRYGESQRNIVSNFVPAPGMSRLEDPISWMMRFDNPPLESVYGVYPADSFAYDVWPGAASAFGTPIDFDSDGMLALDLRGHPLGVAYTGDLSSGFGEADERIDTAYEIDLSGHASNRRYGKTSAWGVSDTGLATNETQAVDAPFTPAEVERLLRFNDIDASELPDRLLQLAPTTFVGYGTPITLNPALIRMRHLVSPASFDLPAPAAQATSADLSSRAAAMAGMGVQPQLVGTGIAQLLRAKMREASTSGTTTPNIPDTALAMRRLLSWDLERGTKMDINRPLGNGHDDNANNIVDEPDEYFATGQYEPVWADAHGGTGIGMDLNNDGFLGPDTSMSRVNEPLPNRDDRYARQLLARHLYCLMMLLKDKNFEVDTDGDSIASPKETAYYFAQWAVNIVDFRDADSIMTPFEFDINPFVADPGATIPGVWNVDGLVSGTETIDYDMAVPYRGLVWGCEKAELLITETLAFHDRRSEDRPDGDMDPSTPSDDDDGGYTANMGNPMPQGDNDFDQRERPQGSLFVELYNPGGPDRIPTAEFYNGAERNVDLAKETPAGAMGQKSPIWRFAIYTAAEKDKDPDDPFDPPASTTIDRTVYFVGYDPQTANPPITDGVAFYRGTTQPAPGPIYPSRYAVIGPAEQTPVGNVNSGMAADQRQITLNPNNNYNITQQVSVANNVTAGDNYPDETNIKPPVAIVIDEPRRLSASEPAGGYTAAVNAMTGFFDPVLDTPPDHLDLALKTTGTTPRYRVLHLQRLANPLLPYDAKTNPYRTVDSAPIDVTAFNGVEGAEDPDLIAGGQVMFESWQRGEGTANGNIWMQAPQQKALVPQLPLPAGTTTPPEHKFNYVLTHSLGYLNIPFQPSWDSMNPAPVAGTSLPVGAYVGDPKQAFPWLTWNDRPYASAYELMLVPRSSSSQLFRQFNVLNPGAKPYQPYAAGAIIERPFSHLQNVYQPIEVTSTATTDVSPNFYRLFDYVHVPSKFVGTETWLSQTPFVNDRKQDHNLHAPFNRLSNFRDPGRLNINTISDPLVWQGLWDSETLSDITFMPATFHKLLESRQGFGGGPIVGDEYKWRTTPTPVDFGANFNKDYPTIFARPFRSFGGSALVPIEVMRDPVGMSGSTKEREIDSTLLRPDPTNASKPLFEFASTAAAYNDPDRNPYFRYQDIGRLGNLVTTRSNVYSIWITIGYFEVERDDISPQHPDGWVLGKELGVDTGQIERHRAFYMYDRSIPVGFERGENHNVEDGILVRRFIE